VREVADDEKIASHSATSCGPGVNALDTPGAKEHREKAPALDAGPAEAGHHDRSNTFPTFSVVYT
jgi:hypothetical protein